MIEDLEMRELFRVESEEHLQHLEHGLLTLEHEPANRGVVEELFREAHSLKGASRMLGLSGVEAVAHRFEEVLGRVTRGLAVLQPEMVDAMCRSLDGMRKLAREAVTGEASGVVVAEVLAQLRQDAPDHQGVVARQDVPAVPLFQGTRPAPAKMEALPAAAAAPFVAPVSQPALCAPEAPVVQEGAASPDSFRIDTVRVETRKLDRLMTQAGELAVSRQRIARRSLEMEALLEKWERLCGALKGGSEREEGISDFTLALERLKSELNEDSSRLATVAGEVGESVFSIRLLPLSNVFNLFPRMVRDLTREQGKEVLLTLAGAETEADKRMLEEIKAPLTHIITNAIDHGIEPAAERVRRGKPPCGKITLSARRDGGGIVIEVEDDGRGLDLDAIRRAALKSGRFTAEEVAGMPARQIEGLIFTPGLSTSSFVSDLSGRGVGLDVVRCNVERLKGEVSVLSKPGEGCAVRLKVPVSLATVRALLVCAAGIEYALPVEYVVKSCRLPQGEIFTIDGRLAVAFEGGIIPAGSLAGLLPCRRTDFLTPGEGGSSAEPAACVVLRVGEENFALLVDEVVDEQEMVLKPQSALLKEVKGTAGATILDTGKVCMVLHPPDLILSLPLQPAPGVTRQGREEPAPGKKSVLVAEDSLTTRTQLKRILEGAGYEVVTAVDGIDALAKLGTRPFDALVSDISMPGMDGLALTEKVRQEARYRELPVILVTMLVSDEDKRRGLEAGANAYITKPAFEQKLLLETLRRLA